ncbi:MAG TPA: hypothetical protein VFW38_10775 [Solirubrobacteraceae bacterium]|nr:hypothetical protein [Solirubrobacteraceae bacterium]
MAVATMGLLLAAGAASATASSPVLEFATPGNAFPVAFTTESGEVKAELAGFESVVTCTTSQGEGEITGPHSTMSEYTFTGCAAKGSSLNASCKSEGAATGEILSEQVEAEPVFIDQARDEVGMLLDPHGGVYMEFECGGESVVAEGPFLAPGSPIDKETMSFTLALSESHGVQTPNEYESADGQKHLALPTGIRGTHQPASTGVEATFTVHTSAPVEVKAVTSAEIEAKQREEAEKARQGEIKTL